jgi:transcriptional regulator with XRE-family HTH domain
MPSPRVAMFQRYVGANVSDLRTAQPLTQEQLAEMAGIEVRYLRLIERGRTNMTLSVLVDLADALGVELSRLVHPAELKAPRPGRPRKTQSLRRQTRRRKEHK